MNASLAALKVIVSAVYVRKRLSRRKYHSFHHRRNTLMAVVCHQVGIVHTYDEQINILVESIYNVSGDPVWNYDMWYVIT